MMTIVEKMDDERLAPPEGHAGITVRGISLTTGIFRRAAIGPLNGFTDEFQQAEDFDFLLRLFERKPRYLLSDTIAIFYRRHEGNITNRKAETRREFLKAMLHSAQRRRLDPSLGAIPQVFDLSNLTNPQKAASSL